LYNPFEVTAKKIFVAKGEVQSGGNGKCKADDEYEGAKYIA
jgi:hypothetical protein